MKYFTIVVMLPFIVLVAIFNAYDKHLENNSKKEVELW